MSRGDCVYVVNAVFGPKGANASGRKLKGYQFRRATVSAEDVGLTEIQSKDYNCDPRSFVHICPTGLFDDIDDVDTFLNDLLNPSCCPDVTIAKPPVLAIPRVVPDDGAAVPAVAATPSRVIVAQRVNMSFAPMALNDSGLVHAGTQTDLTLEQYVLKEHHQELQELLWKTQAELLEAQQEIQQLKRHRLEIDRD